MRRPRRRRLVPTVTLLEDRRLLSGSPTAVWVGQDGHDYAGGAQPLAGNGVQDIHIALANLPAARGITSINMLGYGGGGWVYNIGPYYPTSSGALIRTPGSTTADFYVDPNRVEAPREWDLTLTYDDGSTVTVALAGGTDDPNLRMPGTGVSASWLGQDGVDLTGPTPGVGPDGRQDAHVALARLYTGSPVAGVALTDASGRGWASGVNPGVLNNAEFRPNPGDPSKGDLYFSPDRDPNGQALTVTVTYADGKTDRTTVVAGHADPNLAESGPPSVAVAWNVVHAHWLGQDGMNLLGPGDVHLALDGIPAGRSVAAATLSDQDGLDWTYVKPGSGAAAPDASAGPLGFRAGADSTRADVAFQPGRDETGATLTLTLVLDDGSSLAARVAGDAADPGLRHADVAPTSVVAHPGDDLNDLANRYGHVRLVAGLYPIAQPLVLNNPVAITADPGATLLFAQPPGDPGWAAAIKVRASHTTLDGFAVRFAGPVRWADGISYGPAVVGSTDNTDPWSPDPLVALTFRHLDLQSPPASTAWEEAPRLFRLVSAGSGVVADNLLKGGVTEVQGGPWRITGNDFRGTPPGTFTYTAVATHYSHDVTIAGNTVAPVGPSGKTWRFLVQTQSGLDDVVSGNNVVGVGPMDADTVVNPNSSETILSEAYRLHYEGLTASVSADGMVVQIPAPQGTPARTGDVLAILSGPQAGQWRRVAQVLSPTAYLLDAPITPGKFAVSLATGFVNEMYLGNTVDARGSSTVMDLVLVGNQFGARVVGNHFLGGGQAFKITAAPSETPVTWGWTHAPFLGATVESNTIEDTLHGGALDVEHGGSIKQDAGRVYFSGTFVNNTAVWSAAFLDARAKAGVADPPTMVTVGDALSGDPGELVLASSGNRANGPAGVVSGPTFLVLAATVNGTALRNVGAVLPASSAGAASAGSVAVGPASLAAAPAAAAETAAPAPPSGVAPVPAGAPPVAAATPTPATAASTPATSPSPPTAVATPPPAGPLVSVRVAGAARPFGSGSARSGGGRPRPAGRPGAILWPAARGGALSARSGSSG